jgi:hypothetical protein
LGTSGFSWSEFSDIVERRGLSVPATITLSYLSQEIGIPVPTGVLQRAAVLADRIGFWTRLGFLLRAKPRCDLSRATELACRLARKSQRRRERKSRVATSVQPLLRGRRELPRRSAPEPAHALATQHPLDLPALASGDSMMSIKLLLETAPPALPRRLVWEINGVSRHVARLRYRSLRRRTTSLVLRFDGKVRIDPADLPVSIEARPIGRLRQGQGKAAAARYGALPFRILKAQIKPCDRP